MRENRLSGSMRGGVGRSLALAPLNPSAPPTPHRPRDWVECDKLRGTDRNEIGLDISAHRSPKSGSVFTAYAEGRRDQLTDSE
jgi:hypothetical protein